MHMYNVQWMYDNYAYFGLSRWYRIVSCDGRLDNDVLEGLDLWLKMSLQYTYNVHVANVYLYITYAVHDIVIDGMTLQYAV